ncbi:ribosomal-protein-S18p-alanine acetyltransferase [Klebsiella pneumoniae]|nr:ribosomal-protein-S18p-alanine acetyltransferase [Klebsiella pneumoniae]
MTSRRDWQLQQLGITQWSLRRPGALQGEIAISLPEHIRLVMVAETPPSLTEPLIGDILRALAVTPDQVLQLTPERVAMLPQDSAATAGCWAQRRRCRWRAPRCPPPLLMNSRPARRLAGRSGNKSAHMNTISTLSTADLTKAWHIEKRAHAFPWSEQTLASNQGERYCNYQLSVDGEMAAFAITQVVLDEATLFNIAVDPAYQRRGLGRALLEHVIDEVEKLGVVTLWLEVRASNVAAIALYESVGFNEATIRRNYYPTADGREDAIIMALPISM